MDLWYYKHESRVWNGQCNNWNCYWWKRPANYYRKFIKSTQRVHQAVNKANKVLGMANKAFLNKDKHVMVHLFKSLVRPHLEYAKQAWRPYL